MQSQDNSQQTGTKNETYDVISILYHALKGAENCQVFIQDAKEGPIRDFIQQALQAQRQLADQGKEVLQKCLQNDTGGSSAFGWDQSQDQSRSQSGSSGSSPSDFGGGVQSTFGEQSRGQGQSIPTGQDTGPKTGGTGF
ncbi:MAG: hypothetical protein ABI770_08240 [Sphingomicrobium sp.]